MSADKYRLQRDHAASTRLNIQHMLWVDAKGWLLHPEIEAASQKDDEFEIIDVATGTGIVPLQLSKSLVKQPKSLVGLDISDRQFPHRNWLPSNVQLITGDALDPKQPVPELQHRFNVVHVRFFISLISEDPNTFIDFVLKLLKPGGYLQWGEPYLNSMEVMSDGKEAPGMTELTAFIKGIPAAWLDHLPETLKKRGFEIVEVKKTEFQPWQRGWYLENFKGVANEFVPLSKSTLDQIQAETDEGFWMRAQLYCVVAKLPSA